MERPLIFTPVRYGNNGKGEPNAIVHHGAQDALRYGDLIAMRWSSNGMTLDFDPVFAPTAGCFMT